ncbi:hypothetical protein D3C86_1272950 [compost metagenome]
MWLGVVIRPAMPPTGARRMSPRSSMTPERTATDWRTALRSSDWIASTLTSPSGGLAKAKRPSELVRTSAVLSETPWVEKGIPLVKGMALVKLARTSTPPTGRPCMSRMRPPKGDGVVADVPHGHGQPPSSAAERQAAARVHRKLVWALWRMRLPFRATGGTFACSIIAKGMRGGLVRDGQKT